MSSNEKDNYNTENDAKVIEIKSLDDSHVDEDDSLKIPSSPELEQALKEATESIEKKSSSRKRLGTDEMEPDERQFFQNRIKELHMQLMEKTKEVDKLNDQSLRAQANLENYKKRVMREQAEKFNYGNEDIAKAFLEVHDNLRRALDHAGKSPDSNLIEGIQLTLKSLDGVFERFSITPVKAVGEKFDPNYHEALAQVYREGIEPGMVLEEHLRGFMLKDRLLRPSQVVVAAKPPTDVEN